VLLELHQGALAEPCGAHHGVLDTHRSDDLTQDSGRERQCGGPARLHAGHREPRCGGQIGEAADEMAEVGAVDPQPVHGVGDLAPTGGVDDLGDGPGSAADEHQGTLVEMGEGAGGRLQLLGDVVLESHPVCRAEQIAVERPGREEVDAELEGEVVLRA
jgi:hypothetical protein